MRVDVNLFAVARQLAGTSRLQLELPPEATVADLRDRLIQQVPGLEPMTDQLRFAVDQDYVDSTVKIKPDAQIACIPPVSGG